MPRAMAQADANHTCTTSCTRASPWGPQCPLLIVKENQKLSLNLEVCIFPIQSNLHAKCQTSGRGYLLLNMIRYAYDHTPQIGQMESSRKLEPDWSAKMLTATVSPDVHVTGVTGAIRRTGHRWEASHINHDLFHNTHAHRKSCDIASICKLEESTQGVNDRGCS